MVQNTKNYNFQYKALFYLSWICLYLVFPAWIGLHTVFQGKDFIDLSNPFARSLAILGLIIYFSISALLINRYFNTLIIDKPVIAEINDWFNKIKNNIWLVIVCSLSIVLHIHSLSLVEVGYLGQVFFLYDLSKNLWHKFFDFPIQYGFWSFVFILILIMKQKTMIKSITNYISTKYSIHNSHYLLKLFFVFFMFGLFSLYSNVFPYSLKDASLLLRFPPVSKLFYIIIYYASGVSHIGPRILQLIFYVLSAVYLYRTVCLFYEKERALLAATIYLFSPIIYLHASLTFFASGTVFFMILISFYFLKFIKDNDNRDLILTTYFIGIGFLYKRSILLMLIICFAYLVLVTIKKRDLSLIVHIKILLLSLITILPWLKIGPGVYKAIWTNLITFDELIVYVMMIKSQMSWAILLLFIVSIFYVLFSKKDDLILFYGLFFVAYYFFFTLMEAGEFNHRYAMALYPAIAVFISRLIFGMTQKIRWKHSFKAASVFLAVYLIFLCLVPRTYSNLITFKYKDFEIQYYPIAEATNWIRDRTNDSDKIFLIMPDYYIFYLDRFYADRDKINHRRFIHYSPSISKKLIYSLENLKEYCYTEKISYIMFPYGPRNSVSDLGASKEVAYLKENSSDMLIEVAKFNHEDNYIFIYKLKENSND